MSKTLGRLVYFVPYLYRGRSPPYNYNTKYTSLPRVFDTPLSHSNFNFNSNSNFEILPNNCTPVNCNYVVCNYVVPSGTLWVQLCGSAIMWCAIRGMQLFRYNIVKTFNNFCKTLNRCHKAWNRCLDTNTGVQETQYDFRNP